MSFANQVKNTLLQDISDMANVSWIFSRHPETDFSRKRKIDFQSLLHFSICMEAGTLRHELLKYFPLTLPLCQTLLFISGAANSFRKRFPFYFTSSTLIFPLPYTRVNTAFLPATVLPLLLPEILRIPNLFSLRMAKPQMVIIRFI